MLRAVTLGAQLSEQCVGASTHIESARQDPGRADSRFDAAEHRRGDAVNLPVDHFGWTHRPLIGVDEICDGQLPGCALIQQLAG